MTERSEPTPDDGNTITIVDLTDDDFGVERASDDAADDEGVIDMTPDKPVVPIWTSHDTGLTTFWTPPEPPKKRRTNTRVIAAVVAVVLGVGVLAGTVYTRLNPTYSVSLSEEAQAAQNHQQDRFDEWLASYPSTVRNARGEGGEWVSEPKDGRFGDVAFRRDLLAGSKFSTMPAGVPPLGEWDGRRAALVSLSKELAATRNPWVFIDKEYEVPTGRDEVDGVTIIGGEHIIVRADALPPEVKKLIAALYADGFVNARNQIAQHYGLDRIYSQLGVWRGDIDAGFMPRSYVDAKWADVDALPAGSSERAEAEAEYLTTMLNRTDDDDAQFTLGTDVTVTEHRMSLAMFYALTVLGGLLIVAVLFPAALREINTEAARSAP